MNSEFDKPINIMIVDDSSVMRNILTKIIDTDHMIKLVSTASDGREALSELERNSIDVVLLDVQMPIMDGLEAIPLLLKINPKLKIIIVSSLASPNAECTVKALSLGAVDYIEKPNNRVDVGLFSQHLLLKIRIFGMANRGLYREIKLDTDIKNIEQTKEVISLKEKPRIFKPEIIAIASSTGGPRALMEVMSGLSESFLNNNIIIITQHIKHDFVDLLIRNINAISKLHCKKAINGEKMKPGNIYLAPGDFHFEVKKLQEDFIISLIDSPPENYCRPSADPMFKSLAQLPIRSLAIVLTGIGSDGLNGAMAMASKGNIIIAQDKETSVVWGMPGSVANAGICSAILPLHMIAPYIEKGFI